MNSTAMNGRERRRENPPFPLLMLMVIAIAALGLDACGNPLAVDTPRRVKKVNLDSLVSTEPFINAPGDSIFAHVYNTEVVFATEVLRPKFHNRKTSRGYYVTVQANRLELNSSEYEMLALRIDAITDTGTYNINAQYSAPKQLDSLGPPQYGAAYERRFPGNFFESYGTGLARSGGIIRVVKIDEERGVMVGTFEFKGYGALNDTIATIDHGAFRLQLKK